MNQITNWHLENEHQSIRHASYINSHLLPTNSAYELALRRFCYGHTDCQSYGMKATMLEIIHSFGQLCFTYLITLINELMKIFFPFFLRSSFSSSSSFYYHMKLSATNYSKSYLIWSGAISLLFNHFRLLSLPFKFVFSFLLKKKGQKKHNRFEFDWLIAIKEWISWSALSHNLCAFGISFGVFRFCRRRCTFRLWQLSFRL